MYQHIVNKICKFWKIIISDLICKCLIISKLLVTIPVTIQKNILKVFFHQK